MQGLMRLVCIAYLMFLTALLLTEDPLRLIGVHGNAPSLLRSLMPAAHFLSFGALAVLALSVRWPVPRWAIVMLLVAYGGMTEVAQSFLPPRTPEWADWLQDVAGIGAASLVCWLMAVMVGMRAKVALQTEPSHRIDPVRQEARRASWWR